jgi:hypothetical protein
MFRRQRSHRPTARARTIALVASGIGSLNVERNGTDRGLGVVLGAGTGLAKVALLGRLIGADRGLNVDQRRLPSASNSFGRNADRFNDQHLRNPCSRQGR